MKTLKDHTILYDEVCPLCNAYTGAFVRTGLLDPDGRAPYQQLPAATAVDRTRAADEIALVNKRTGEVHYGIQSLFLIIGHAFPVFRPLFRNRVFAFVMRRFYRFISYNRRVIMPARNADASRPSFHAGYRIAWLIFTWLCTAGILHRYSALMTPLVPAGGYWRELLICGGQMVWQGLIVLKTDRARSWDYLGTMMTVSFGGALLLSTVLLIAHFTGPNPLIFTGCFLAVAGLMLLEHIRRTSVLGLHKILSFTWVLYRALLLLVILK